jgi:hypothetical protein
MNEQPKAVTLAEWIEADIASVPNDTYFNWRDREVVAELRRLSAVVAQRDALLEALKKLDNFFETYRPEGHPPSDSHELVRAAIKAVEGEKE